MRFQFPGSRRWLGFFVGVTALSVMAACASAPSDGPAPGATIALSDGRYTPLGRVRVSDNPTASNFADLQAAEGGKTGLPAFVEFYADN